MLGATLRDRLGTHNFMPTDAEVSQHLARNLFPIFSIQTSVLHRTTDLTAHKLEEVVLTACGEQKMKKKEANNGTGHALVAAWADRGNGDLNMGAEFETGKARGKE